MAESSPEQYDVAPPPPAKPPTPAPPPPAPGSAAPPEKKRLSEKDERTFGMLCHLLGVCGFFIPFGNVIGPLVIWLIKREESEFVDDQGKEAVNWQITVTLAAMVLTALFIVFRMSFLPFLGPHYLIMIANIVFIVLGATTANKGIKYRYPVSLRLIS